MKELSNYQETVTSLLNQQQFNENDLDYSILEKHIRILENMALIGNSAISVFDMYKQEHVFYSNNFGRLIGYDIKEPAHYGPHFLQDKVHPDDFWELTMNGISILKLFLQFPPQERANFKFINEYRILKADNTYIRVVEQDQIMTFDGCGNMWLSLGIIDISPNQDLQEPLKSQVFNFRTGEMISLQQERKKREVSVSLTQRELEVLKLVKTGFLSKEISHKLAISIHTVNTHRQRILEKLHADNSMEAVVFASDMGLI
ncbi:MULTISPECIES: response regulator transcription factor [Niastella]|uniref:Response regulator transcription factor n=1 Tax=Niastella soli TaxID=2821487 RepID=A0ABS3YLB1_9BACT|nr:LuxR C-terminal-related transcriptional regulator [Niastella soli]MBO9198639.1 response regulator transcription factor [Niastella soli]